MRTYFKIAFSFLGFILVSNSVLSQQAPLYSQYMMNRFLINPALAGNDGYTSINMTAKEQWVGFQDAPSTQSVSFQTRLLKTSYISKSTAVKKKMRRPSRSGRVGLGAHIYNDQNGMFRRTGVQLTYAFHIPLKDNSQLSFGLSAVGYQFSISENGFFDSYDPNDPLLLAYDRNLIIPDANFGVYFKTPDYYIGFSIHNLFESIFKLGTTKDLVNNYRLLRYYYITGAYEFYLSDNLVIQPSILMKSPDNFRSFQMDLSARLLFMENYWGGISYRTIDAMVIFAGLRIGNFYFGYAFDYQLNSIRKHTLGSHEFMFAVKLGDSARRYRWISRY